jgi:gentisate 1,2-dioxygenase
MIDSSPAAFAAAGNMEELLELLSHEGVGPGWAKREPSLYPSPHLTFLPAHWSYETGKAALDAAGRYVSTELAERRNLILHNPVKGNDYSTVRSLVCAYQMVLAGETAHSHRHTANALRLVVDAAPRAYTVVEGRKIPMVPGDVLLTPNWCWHGHANESDRPAYWIDFLDVPLVHFLEPMFFEPWPGGAKVQEATIVDEASPMRFPFAATRERLDRARESQPGERMVLLGPPDIDTMRLQVLRLEARGRFSAPRTTANAIFAVIDGSGVSSIDGTEIEWRRGDVFALPSWRAHTYRAHERSHLLRVSDEPVLERLHWLRRENGDVPCI